MDEIVCIYCKSSFENYKLLFEHISSLHNLLNNFRCFIQNCSRAYSTFNSFKKHILQKHASFVVSTNKNVTSESTDEFYENYEDQSLYQEITVSDESDSDESMMYDSSDETDFDDSQIGYLLNEPLKDSVIKYSANIANMKKIPRKYVNDILNETNDF